MRYQTVVGLESLERRVLEDASIFVKKHALNGTDKLIPEEIDG
jgi:hypothetical protein